MELIDSVIKTLHIPEGQAKAGIGLLFKAAKEQVPEQDFSKLSDAIPDINEYVSCAPANNAMGGLMGRASSFFGAKAAHFSTMTNLASGFSKAGMDKDTLMKMLPLVLDYMQDKGGEDAKEILERVIH
jgi:hypothetical protein